MNRKILLSLLIALSIALTGCGLLGGDEEEVIIVNSEATWKTAVAATITEMSKSNPKMKITFSQGETESSLTVDGNKEVMAYPTYTQYTELGSVWVSHYFSDGEHTHSNIADAEETTYIQRTLEGFNLDLLKDDFDLFTMTADNEFEIKEDALDEERFYATENAKIVFENGKIASIQVTQYEELGTFSFTYEGVSVTIPTLTATEMLGAVSGYTQNKLTEEDANFKVDYTIDGTANSLVVNGIKAMLTSTASGSTTKTYYEYADYISQIYSSADGTTFVQEEAKYGVPFFASINCLGLGELPLVTSSFTASNNTYTAKTADMETIAEDWIDKFASYVGLDEATFTGAVVTTENYLIKTIVLNYNDGTAKTVTFTFTYGGQTVTTPTLPN